MVFPAVRYCWRVADQRIGGLNEKDMGNDQYLTKEGV